VLVRGDREPAAVSTTSEDQQTNASPPPAPRGSSSPSPPKPELPRFRPTRGWILFAIALLTDRPPLLRWAVWAWVVGGVVLLLFGAMNFYTHIGMYYNIEHGTMHKW